MIWGNQIAMAPRSSPAKAGRSQRGRPVRRCTSVPMSSAQKVARNEQGGDKPAQQTEDQEGGQFDVELQGAFARQECIPSRPRTSSRLMTVPAALAMIDRREGVDREMPQHHLGARKARRRSVR